MKTFQSINELMFANSIVNSKDMAVILGGLKDTATGAGGRSNGEVPGGESYSRWDSDSCDENGSCSYKNYSTTVMPC